MTSKIEGLREGERKILDLLDKNTMYGTEIVEHEEIEAPRPTVYSRLNALIDEDLVRKEKHGQRVYYSTTKSWQILKDNKKDLKNAAEDWHELCEEQAEKLDTGEIALDEFMNRAFGTLVPLLLQSILGEAYTRAINLSDDGFDDKPDGNLNRRQQELFIFAYDLCREYEFKGLSSLHQAIPESDDVEPSDHLNRPISPLADLVENGL